MIQTDKPVANPLIVLREEFDDWAVLFNPDTAEAVGTNPVGVAVWKMMDVKKSIGTIVSEIQRLFENAPDAVSAEIATFVNKLADSGFAGLELERNTPNA